MPKLTKETKVIVTFTDTELRNMVKSRASESGLENYDFDEMDVGFSSTFNASDGCTVYSAWARVTKE